MGFSLTSSAPEKGDPTAKNRVWGFFGDAQEMHRANRAQPKQPRQGDRPSLTKTVSGRTYWPSRDPIGERGGMNLYDMVGNNSVNTWDHLGLQEESDDDLDRILDRNRNGRALVVEDARYFTYGLFWCDCTGKYQCEKKGACDTEFETHEMFDSNVSTRKVFIDTETRLPSNESIQWGMDVTGMDVKMEMDAIFDKRLEEGAACSDGFTLKRFSFEVTCDCNFKIAPLQIWD